MSRLQTAHNPETADAFRQQFGGFAANGLTDPQHGVRVVRKHTHHLELSGPLVTRAKRLSRSSAGVGLFLAPAEASCLETSSGENLLGLIGRLRFVACPGVHHMGAFDVVDDFLW